MTCQEEKQQLRAIVRLHRAAVICLRRRIVRGDRFSGIITVICTITIIAISIVGIGTHGAGIITVLSVTGCIITGFLTACSGTISGVR